MLKNGTKGRSEFYNQLLILKYLDVCQTNWIRALKIWIFTHEPECEKSSEPNLCGKKLHVDLQNWMWKTVKKNWIFSEEFKIRQFRFSKRSNPTMQIHFMLFGFSFSMCLFKFSDPNSHINDSALLSGGIYLSPKRHSVHHKPVQSLHNSDKHK